MKKLIIKFTSLCFAFLILYFSVTSAYAAEELTINDTASVNVGDKIKFTLYLSETKEDIIGFELRLFYDSEYLEFDKESLQAEYFDSMIYNPNIEGKIPMNWSDISNPVGFSDKAEFVSCEFTVIKGGSAEISYFVTEMYGDDMTYLKSYKWTYDVSVNGENVITDGVPPVSTDEETLSSRQSSFINYIDGMGEENSPNGDNHEAVIGEQGATYNVYENEVIDVTKYVEVESDKQSSRTPYIIVLAVVLSALIIVAVILVKRNKK